MSPSLSVPLRRVLLRALAPIMAAATPMFAQNFPGENWKDFSDTMVETPDTSMAFDPNDVPEVQPEPDYAGTPATVEAEPDVPDTGGNNYEGPIGVTGVIDNVTTGCSYSPLSHNALRGPITDIDVPGSLGKYGLKMRRYYNSRSSHYWDRSIGLSPGWFHEYSWLLWSAGSKVISAQGNISDFHCGRPVGVSEGWDDGNQAPHPSGGIWRLADGGRVHFSGGYPDYVEDPYGLRTTITRDGQNRVWKVTEPGRRYLQFTYGTTPAYIDPAYGTQLLQKVEAYDGQGHFIERVTYTYTRVDSGGVIPTTGEHVIRRMLTGVAYDDATTASYSYRTDNVPDTPTSPPYTFKFDPLLKGCNDKRYNGPMRQIAYDYQNLGPHGAIRKEYQPNGSLVSKIEPDLPLGANGQLPNEFTETRGDLPQRKFHYTDFQHTFCPPEGEQCDPCEDYGDNYAWPDRAPQQMLKWYSDFQGNKTYLHYNPNWYIDTVTDANGNATQYERGNPPWQGGDQGGIGEIKTITHPAGAGYPASSIHYDYYPEPSALDGHYLYHITNENGKITTIHRDANNRIYEILYPVDGNTPASGEGFAYNGFGQVTAHLMRNGAWESFAYDTRGLLTDKWEPKFGTYPPAGSDPHTHYEYYTSGPWVDQVKTVTGPLPNYQYSAQTSETYEYDRTLSGAACSGRGLVTKITHADGRNQSLKYDQWGNKWREWNELGEGTQYAYDDYKRVTSVTNTAANEVTSYTYFPPNGGSPYLHTTNSPDTITAPTGIMTSNGYDQNWRKTSTAVAGRTTWFHYDLVGNMKYVTDPRGSENDLSHFTTSTDYDTRNRKWHVWDAQGNRTTFTYDDASNVLDIQRPDTTHEAKTYDALNRVITDTVPFKTRPTVNLTTWFIYNPSGTIQKVTDSRGTSGRTYPSGDPNYTTSFEYNAWDQKTKMTYPLGGSFQSWAYDDAHNMKSRTTPHGETKYFAYDNRNRKYGEAWENLSGEWAFYIPDAASRLGRAVNGIWQGQTPVTIADVHREYDHAGRLTLDKQDITGFGVTEVHYQYDKTLRGTDGKPTLMYVNNLGDNYDYDFRYDEMGRFEKILYHDSSLFFKYHYDNASNETQRDNLLNHVNQIYDPDELNRTRKVELRYNNSGFWLESYDYYPIGRLHSVTRGNVQDQFNYYLDGELQSVFYDAMAAQAPDPNEILPAENPAKQKTVDDVVALPDGMGPGAPQTNPRTVTYDLDNAGNRTGVTDSLSGSTSYTPNNLNQYTGSTGGAAITNGYEHEINGYNNVGYTYMKDEHLIRVSSDNTTYDLAYDALGRCVKRTVRTQTIGIHQPDTTPRPRPTPHPRPSPPPPSPTPSATPSPTPPGQVEVTKYYVYDGERPILEYFPDRELAGYNLYGKGVDEILLRFDPTGPDPQPFYFQQDHEGNITHLTYNPPAGQTPILEYYRYDVFGTPAIYDAANPPHVRTASLYSNRFLFTGREWAANFGFYEYRARAYHPGLGRFMSEDPKLFDAGDYNLFRYCHNDPIDFTDPMGLESPAWAQAVIPGQIEWDAAVANFQAGNYGTAAAAFTAMLGQQVAALYTLGGSMRAQQSLQAARIAITQQQTANKVAAVIGKYPNYLVVADEVGAKRFNIPANIWNKMSEAQQWVANQKFLDRTIARGGDIMLDKPLKDISSVSGQLRKELNYLNERGYQLSQDGSRMIKTGAEKAAAHVSDVIHSKPDPLNP